MLSFQRPMIPALTLLVQSAKFNLNVLICTPEFGTHHHWAVQLENLSTGDGTIFEVRGCHPTWKLATYQCRKAYYPLKILKTVCIKEFDLSISGFGAVAHAIEHQVAIKTGSPEWNGQDYVLGVLDMLEDEWWLDIDDDDYIQMKTKLKAMYGPMRLAQKAVAAYPEFLLPDAGPKKKGNDVMDIGSLVSGQNRKASVDST